MLKLLRKKKVAKRIFYVLAAIVIPAFIIWGSASVINKDKRPNYAGIIFGKKVSFDDFRRALLGWRVQLKLQYGDRSNEIAQSLFNPVQAAWDRLILLHEAEQRKVKIDNEDVISLITQLPFLQKDGRFDQQTYEIFLKYSIGEHPRVFEEQIRENLAMAEVFQQVTADVSVSEEEIKKEYKLRNEQTRIKYIPFLAEEYKDLISPTEEEIKDYYESEKESFKIPPQINAAYVGIEFDEDTDQAKKTEAAERLKEVRVLTKNKDFQEAAKEFEFEVKETGPFGFEDPIPTLGWIPQLSELLFGLPTDFMSEIIVTERGAFLFKILERRDARIPEFQEIKEEVKTALVNEKAREMGRKAAQDFLKEVEDKDLSLEKAAERSKLKIKESPFFSRQDYIPKLGMAQPLKEVVFDLKAKDVADKAIELEQGFYAVKSEEFIQIDKDRFKEEKEGFSEELLQQKRTVVFNEFFQELRRRAGLVSYVSGEQRSPAAP